MRVAGAVLVFVSASVSSAIALAFPCGGLSRALAWAAFAVGLTASVLAWRSIRPTASPRPNAWDAFMLTVFALASLRGFLWLIYPVGDEWRVLSPNNLGDISLHIHLIRYLAGGVDFWPASPILAGAPLVYPIGCDLLNSLLFCTGVPVERGLVWAGMAGALLTGWALWRWGGAFAVAAFLFNGGLAGFLLFQTLQIADFQAELAWKNFFLSMLVTQRGLLYALPCGLFLLCAWREDFFRSGSGVPGWIAFLLYATMPLFNVHAFLFLSLVLAAAFVLRPHARRSLLAFVGSAVIPASVAMYFVTGGFSAASGLRWLPGWMQADGGLGFWIWNFGVSLPLLLLLAWQILKSKAHEAMCFAGTGFMVFVMCCLFSFSQWEWDNTKLMLWGWLACAPFLWSMIASWPPLLRTAVCFALFFSGALSLAGGLDARHGYKLASRSELADAEEALKKVPLTSRIAIKPDFNNPAMLLGRPVLCGYEGHLWSHGLNYREQWSALQHALQKHDGWQRKLHRFGTDWVFIKGPPPEVLPVEAPAPGKRQ